MERARPEGAVGAEPQREAVAEEVLPLAADAERELEAPLVRADALRGPERARLGLAVGRQAREVAVHGRGPVRALRRPSSKPPAKKTACRSPVAATANIDSLAVPVFPRTGAWAMGVAGARRRSSPPPPACGPRRKQAH